MFTLSHRNNNTTLTLLFRPQRRSHLGTSLLQVLLPSLPEFGFAVASTANSAYPGLFSVASVAVL